MGRKGIARIEVAPCSEGTRMNMPDLTQRSRLFLISPASAHGPRAQALRRQDSGSSLARRLREEGVPLGDVFSFVSGLYFRGKLEYARAFAHAPGDEAGGVYIITMTDGLVSADMRVSSQDLERYARCEGGRTAAASTLEATARSLAGRIGELADVVLLGSVGTGKYTDLLAPVFGERLLFPRDVLHIGQLARGALFLDRAREGKELEYVPVTEIVRAGRRVSIRAESAPSHEAASKETPSRATPPSTPAATADFRR
jgi:hypothetical protein